MVSTEILNVMTEDHERIIGILNEIIKMYESHPERLSDRVERFIWLLKKHMFVEEQAIFESYSSVVTDGYEMIPRLVDDHNTLLSMLRDLQKKLLDNKKTDFEAFKRELYQHKDFEEESVYPRLDQELTPEDRERLLNQIREIV